MKYVTSEMLYKFQYPFETYGYGFLFSLSGYLGVNIVLTMVKSFGALVAVTGRENVFDSIAKSVWVTIVAERLK